MSQIYKFTTKNSYGERVTIEDSWPDWQKRYWIGALTGDGYVLVQPAWTPTYEVGTVSWPGEGGKLVQISIGAESKAFPTRATVDILAQKYAFHGLPLRVVEVPFLAPGADSSSLTQRFLQIPTNGNLIPAAQLANYYTNNPDNINDAADQLCKNYISRFL